MALCPAEEWDMPHGDSPFSQVVFHTLFYADYYLQFDPESFRIQSFHESHRSIFDNYEELEDRIPVKLYAREFCETYLEYCKNKCETTIQRETAKTLREASTFRRELSRIEFYVYLIRHIQHHAAQLALRVQSVTGSIVPWISL